MYFNRKLKNAVWAVSGTVGLIIILTPMATGFYVPGAPYIIPLSQRINNVLALGLLIAFAFPALVEFNNFRWGRQVDKNIPKLLRDITETVRSGMTLPRAIEEASQRSYGPISGELEHTILDVQHGSKL